MHSIRQKKSLAFFAALFLMLPIGLIGSYQIGLASRSLNEDQAKIVWFLYNPALISASFVGLVLLYCYFRQQYVSWRYILAGAVLAFVESLPMQLLIVLVLSPWWVSLLGPVAEPALGWMIISVCAWILTMILYGGAFIAYGSLRRQTSQ